MITNHWREIFDPAAQIFLNSVVSIRNIIRKTMFESEFCKVEYLQNINAVLCTWKKYCEFKDYKEPLQYGLKLINQNSATT